MTLVFSAIFFLLFLFYIIFLIRILNGINKTMSEVQHKIPDKLVSIIIPFRNESDNILKSLESIKSQDYPTHKYEAIYINDCSEDDSLQKIMTAEKPENIRIISLENNNSDQSNKRDALSYGIKHSQGDIIVTTDCDCYHGPHWVKNLLSYYDDNTAFISGPVAFIDNSTTFQILQSIEFAGLILAGAGLIGINKPIICNAANATFRKDVYFEMIKYYKSLNLSSADDEVLMRVIAEKSDYNVKFAFNKEAITYTYANRDLSQFFQQRKRWVNNSFSYGQVSFLSGIFLFIVSVPVQLVLGITLNVWFLLLFLIVYMGKSLMEYIILKKGVEFLVEKLKLKHFILAELFHIPYIIISVLSGVIGNFEWKNRKLKR